MDNPAGLWVYCVVENRKDWEPDCLGIHGTRPVFVVGEGNFAALVSEEPMKKYPLVRDTLIAHQRVNEKAMEAGPVLPVRFCTMAESREQIVSQVLANEKKTEEFHKALRLIRGKNEFGLRARWKNLDRVFADLGLENEKVRTTREKILRLPAHERHAALIDAGHVAKEAIEEKNAKTAEMLTEGLIPHAFRHKKNKTLGDMNILNAAFLVEEKRQALFDETVSALVGRLEPEIQFKYVGPTPPFNFVEIVIRWNEADPEGEGEGEGEGD